MADTNNQEQVDTTDKYDNVVTDEQRLWLYENNFISKDAFEKNGYEVYELLLKDDDEVQGMIALKHIRDQYYTHIDIVEAAPHNIGKNGKYKGVGAHLFAIACKLSWEVGNEGYVQFTAKTDLVEHYQQTLNAKPIDWHTMYIDSYGAIALIKKYFKEGE